MMHNKYINFPDHQENPFQKSVCDILYDIHDKVEKLQNKIRHLETIFNISNCQLQFKISGLTEQLNSLDDIIKLERMRNK